MGYVRKEEIGESSGDNFKSIKDANSTSSSSSDHDCGSFPNGSEHCKERSKLRYKNSQYSKVHFIYKHIVNDQRKSSRRKPFGFFVLYNHVIF